MSKRILIVDDAAFMRMMIKDILVKNGFEVVGEAQDGVQAVELFNELNPDLVTMDITMPEMDGITALKKLKNKVQLPKLLCALLWDNKRWLLMQSKLGAKDFIVKPFQADRVIEAIQKALD